jgi:hypothetical protein
MDSRRPGNSDVKRPMLVKDNDNATLEEAIVRRLLLTCGVIAPLIYIATDIAAARLYPGYSYSDQAVSELFAIGAPTATMVVRLFTLSSALFVLFSVGFAYPCQIVSCG